MAQTTYQVILSTDGKHTVIVTAEDIVTAKTAIGWAAATYDRLVERYGLKYEQYRRNGEQNSGKDAEDSKEDEEVPTCTVHDLPMVKQMGKHGAFWSCHQRNSDGSFCSYRPPRR